MSKRNLLDILTEGRKLPPGCDAWGIRSVHPDGASRHGFIWPLAPGWVEAPGPIDYTNTDPCPANVGDGICLAHTWGGMALGGIVARTLLLCAYATRDVLCRAPRGDIIRLERAHVAAVIDGERLVREHGRGARLRHADLRRADLSGADLRNADLLGAELHGADLTSVDLSGADLRDADLTCADLTGAHLDGANLRRADLSSTNLGCWERDPATGFARWKA